MEQTIVQHYGIISTFLPFDNELRSPGLVKGWKNHFLMISNNLWLEEEQEQIWLI
jgi:hypothetical protein